MNTLVITKANCVGYLELCDLKVKIIECIQGNDKFNSKQFIMDCDSFDYGVDKLCSLCENVQLSYQELKSMGFNDSEVTLTLYQVFQNLTLLIAEMKSLLEKYPYVDSQIPLNEIVESLKIANVINEEQYENYIKYLVSENLNCNKKI